MSVATPAPMSAAECSEALSANFPGEAFDAPAPIFGGWSFWTFAVGDLIVRFPVSGPDAMGLEREFRLLPELGRRLPVPVPQYTLRGQWKGRAFGAYRRLPGEALDAGGRVVPAGSPVFAELAAALRALHDFPVALAVELAGTEEAETERFWEAVFADALPLLPAGLRELAEVGITRHRSAGHPLDALVHRDLGFVHILSDGRHLTGIIDWTDACIGDPAKDFVGLFARGGRELVARVLREYWPVPADFEQRVAFFAWVAPLHDIIYGLTTNQPEHVADGVRGVERRMRAAGLIV